MPPLPPSSSAGGVVVVSGAVVGSVEVVGCVVVVGSVVVVGAVAVGSVLVDSVVWVVVELAGVDSEPALESPPLPLLAITTTATRSPTMTATSPATSKRMLPWG